MYVETFPNKLKKARENAGYSQQYVTEITGISQSNISKYENGILQPDIENLGILADLYEVSIDWLIGTKGENHKKS